MKRRTLPGSNRLGRRMPHSKIRECIRQVDLSELRKHLKLVVLSTRRITVPVAFTTRTSRANWTSRALAIASRGSLPLLVETQPMRIRRKKIEMPRVATTCKGRHRTHPLRIIWIRHLMQGRSRSSIRLGLANWGSLGSRSREDTLVVGVLGSRTKGRVRWQWNSSSCKVIYLWGRLWTSNMDQHLI